MQSCSKEASARQMALTPKRVDESHPKDDSIEASDFFASAFIDQIECRKPEDPTPGFLDRGTSEHATMAKGAHCHRSLSARQRMQLKDRGPLREKSLTRKLRRAREQIDRRRTLVRKDMADPHRRRPSSCTPMTSTFTGPPRNARRATPLSSSMQEREPSVRPAREHDDHLNEVYQELVAAKQQQHNTVDLTDEVDPISTGLEDVADNQRERDIEDLEREHQQHAGRNAQLRLETVHEQAMLSQQNADHNSMHAPSLFGDESHADFLELGRRLGLAKRERDVLKQRLETFDFAEVEELKAELQ